MSSKCHNCDRPYETWEASPDQPYHYTESGLDSIFLIDITVYSCPNCEVVSADIPDLDGLHNLISEDILLKPQPMSGKELRFLRKETRLILKEFAERMGVDPKTVKNWETSDKLAKPIDFTARVLVASRLWENEEMTKMLVEIGKLAQYGWEEEAKENLDQEITQLAEENTVLEFAQEHEWRLAA